MKVMNEDILFTTAKEYGVKQLIPVIVLNTFLVKEYLWEKKFEILGENSVTGLLLNHLRYHPSKMDDIIHLPAKFTIVIHLWVFVCDPTITFYPDPANFFSPWKANAILPILHKTRLPRHPNWTMVLTFFLSYLKKSDSPVSKSFRYSKNVWTTTKTEGKLKPWQ